MKYTARWEVNVAIISSKKADVKNEPSWRPYSGFDVMQYRKQIHSEHLSNC